MSFGLLQVFHVELGRLYRTSNWTIWSMGIDCSISVYYDRVKVLSYRKYTVLFSPVIGIEPSSSRRFHTEAFSN